MQLLAEGGILNWLVGNNPDRAGTPKLQWANLPESWGVFVLIAILLAISFGVFWLYRREINTCPMPVKLLMAGLRLTVMLLLVVLFLKPSVFYQQVNEIKPAIPILRDSSISVARGDQYRDSTVAERLAAATGLDAAQIGSGAVDRAELINRAFSQGDQLVTAFRDKGTVRVIDFDDGTRTAAILPANAKRETAEDEGASDEREAQSSSSNTGMIQETVPDLAAEGLGTDIWQVLRTTLDDASRISSIVLVSDFQHNGSEDPIELAERAGALGIPIYTVGVGDPNPPKNLSVNEVYVRNKAYPNEPFEIEAILQTSQTGREGLPGQIKVNLLQRRLDPRTGELGEPEQINVKDVNVPQDGGRIRVDFEHVLGLPGKYVYVVSTDPVEDETHLDDNARASSELEVVDEKVKVLLVAGLPSWDYHHVRTLLQRDQTIALSCWLQSMDEARPQEGNEPISRLPRTIEELGQYNVVILMDPNPQEFDRAWMETLEQFCRFKAGGVLFMAGKQFTAEFVTMNRLRAIRDLLPVKFGDTEYIDTTQALANVNSDQPGEMLVVNHNLDHAVMSFKSDPAETQKIWDVMPSVQWNFPAMAAKPTARVLLERGDQQNVEGNTPLMVAGRFGAGSVLYLGFQDTFLWRRLGLQAQYFDRFWIQVIRYLVETRSLQGSRRGFLDSDKSEYELGDRVTLVGRVLNQQFQPSDEPEMEAIISTADGRKRTVALRLLPQQKGSYEGSFVAQRLGNYTATIDLGVESERESLVEPVSFRVVTPSAESGSFWLNESLMNSIASQSGGKAFRLDQLADLAAELPTVVTRAEFNSPPKPLWDVNQYVRFAAFLLPVILLTTEWALRKWFKLL